MAFLHAVTALCRRYLLYLAASNHVGKQPSDTVEGVDSLNPIGQHGRHDLQIEYICSDDGAALDQLHPSRNHAGRTPGSTDIVVDIPPVERTHRSKMQDWHLEARAVTGEMGLRPLLAQEPFQQRFH